MQVQTGIRAGLVSGYFLYEYYIPLTLTVPPSQ
jgi:hypothetical protein